MSKRPTSDTDRRGLKLAAQRTVGKCGGQDSAASVTRVGRNTLSDYANTGNDRHTDTHMPVDVLADFILDCRERGEEAPLLMALCEMAGGTFVPVPEPDRSTSARQLELAAMGKRLWGVSTVVSRHLADELDELGFRDQVLPLIQALQNDLATLKQALRTADPDGEGGA